VSEVGLVDKSWSAKNVDSNAVISIIEKDHPAEGISLRLMAAFGMRFKEAVCFKPHSNVYADGTHIMLVDGAKGARTRVLKIETVEQRAALAKAQAYVKKKTGFMMERHSNDLKQNIQRLYYICRKYGISKKGYGITCYGLRHEFVNDHMEKNGVVSPVRGGSPEAFFSKENRQLRYEVAQMTGHNRPKVTGRYCGGKVGRIRKKALKPGVGINSSDSHKSSKQRRHRGLRKAIKVLENAKRVKELHQAILDSIKEPS
jgi:integrase